MIIRRVAGLGLVLVGLWLGWQSLQWLLQYTSRGAPMGDALADPVFFLPMARSVFAALGGLLALLAVRGGVWLAFLATIMTGLLAGLIILGGGDPDMWRAPAVWTGILLALSLVLLLRQRTA